MQRYLSQRLNIGLVAILAALCLLFLTTLGAVANTVNISDPVHVLNAAQVRSEASNLPNPMNIYTTNTFNGTSADFEQRTHSHITSSNLIVMAIDTLNKHVAIVGGANVPLQQSQYDAATQAFVSAYKSNGGDYTASTIASIRSLRSSLGAAPVAPGNNPSSGSRSAPAGGGLFSGLFGTLCCVGLFILALAGLAFFVGRRMFGFGRRGPAMPYQQPYVQQPYNQGYPPNYSGPYNQGSGINPLAAGGLGAAAGGLLGYELGKERGEDEAREDYRDQGGNYGGNYGGNDYGGGSVGDFGNGGGGSSGDFGGGGGDMGGGSSGSF